MLLDQLTKQEPGQDRDEGIWNLSMAAGTCLGLVAQCVKDEIVSLVMPYVQVRMMLPHAAAFADTAAAVFTEVLLLPIVSGLLLSYNGSHLLAAVC